MGNAEQPAIWNATVGQAWVTHADHFDRTLEPFGEAVIERLGLSSGERVVDIGCGTGATTVRLGTIVAPGTVEGVDVSAPMLTAARARASSQAATNVDFVEGDVQEVGLGSSRFDAAYSRCGVMFFSDPVKAFVNIHEALVEGGRLGFVCFQDPSTNPFIVVPIFAAAGTLRLPPPPSPTDPGPFSFADPERVTGILKQAGFVEVAVTPGPDRADLGDADDLPALATRLLEQNPGVAPFLAAASDADRAAAIAASAEALRSHVANGRVQLAAGTWIVTARRPS
jgi:SAM-dependent methyltransferase